MNDRATVPRFVLGATVLAATLTGCFGDGESEERAAAVAQRYAVALSSGSSAALAAVTCELPTPQQARAFDERAGGGRLKWTVLEPPEVHGDRADGVLRATDQGTHRDYPVTLWVRGDQWCAHYVWTRVK